MNTVAQAGLCCERLACRATIFDCHVILICRSIELYHTHHAVRERAREDFIEYSSLNQPPVSFSVQNIDHISSFERCVRLHLKYIGVPTFSRFKASMTQINLAVSRILRILTSCHPCLAISLLCSCGLGTRPPDKVFVYAFSFCSERRSTIS